MMFIKSNIVFFKRAIIACATAADLKTTKMHEKNVLAQIEKNKKDTYVGQSCAVLKNTKWVN